MAIQNVLERKNRILKKDFMKLAMKKNSVGLSKQENRLMHHFIKEYHQNSYELK